MHPIVISLLRKLGIPAAIFLVGSIVGAWAVYKLYHLGEVRELRSQLEDQYEEHQLELEFLQAHHQEALNIQKDRVVIKEITKYVPDIRECDLQPDAVRLLDLSRTGAAGDTGGTDEGAGAAAVYPRIPQRIEVEAHADCGIRYRQLANQLTNLIRLIREKQRLLE